MRWPGILMVAGALFLGRVAGGAAQDGEIFVGPGHWPPLAPAEIAEISASGLIETPVVSATGADLGQVADVIIDAETRRVIRIVISRGGVAGFFEDVVAVEADAIRLAPADGRIVAPGLTPDEIERLSGPGDPTR